MKDLPLMTQAEVDKARSLKRTWDRIIIRSDQQREKKWASKKLKVTRREK